MASRLPPLECHGVSGSASASAGLRLTIVYSRSGFLGWERGDMRSGGYTACLGGFGEAGQDTTIEAAVDQLAERLRNWVADLDADADYAPLVRAGRLGHRTLLRAVQQLLIDGSLRATLREVARATEPVLDSADEPTQ